MPRKTREPIDPSIKRALGYNSNEPDDALLKDWKSRTTNVCKPCWELKYCPYGPLVEQSPTLPPERAGMIDQIEYFKECLRTNLVGSVRILSAETREQYEAWSEDDQLLLRQAKFQMDQRDHFAEASKYASDDERIHAWIGGPLPAIHIYRAPFDHEDKELTASDFSPQIWVELNKTAKALKEKYLEALRTGSIDDRSPLEAPRAAWFRKRIQEFAPENFPEKVPDIFTEAVCNVFGHICPVFFAAEALTETSMERRRGRYIPFAVKMRVVRRDNHTCQHCSKHLRDDEVEFDHIIPIAKGGSSEEHNIRLTCFDCNRDKSDEYTP